MKWAGVGAALGAALLAALHLSANVEPAGVEAAWLYAALTAVGAGLGWVIGWVSRPPKGEPTRRDVVIREVAVGMRNGALCGIAYSLLRLTVFLSDRVVPLWFLAAYSAGVVALFTLGLGAFGAVIGAIKARDVDTKARP
jgi:hypothetical protein